MSDNQRRAMLEASFGALDLSDFEESKQDPNHSVGMFKDHHSDGSNYEEWDSSQNIPFNAVLTDPSGVTRVLTWWCGRPQAADGRRPFITMYRTLGVEEQNHPLPGFTVSCPLKEEDDSSSLVDATWIKVPEQDVVGLVANGWEI